MNIDLKGEVAKVVERISHQTKSRAFRASNELRNSALTVLRGQRSGRIYRRPFASGTYTASAPGEPPAVRSGDLRRSWRQKTASESTSKGMTVRPAITTEVKYAPWLDEGTPKMAPHPFKKPIIGDAMPRIRMIFKELY